MTKRVKLSDEVGSNTHLLIVWEQAMHCLPEIEADLDSGYVILHKFHLRWSEEHVHANMGRFYGKKLPDIAHKVTHCGAGVFVVYLVNDSSPEWAILNTSSGPQLVNRRIFEAKKRYRELAGGGHKVHATNNQSETLRDAVLLFGLELPKTESADDTVCRDLIGAETWHSLTEFFAVLNLCTKYVVLRNFEALPERHDTQLHGDIDILCSDRDELSLLANAKRAFPQRYRRHYFVNVGGESVPVDIRDIYERYYCERWSLDIIRQRVSKGGLYIPAQHDYLYSLAYHALMHKRSLSPDYEVKLVALFDSIDQVDPVNSGMGYLADKLKFFMLDKGYSYVRPLDWSVYFNYRNSPEVRLPLWALVTCPPTTFRHLKREVLAILTAVYQRWFRVPVAKMKKIAFKNVEK